MDAPKCKLCGIRHWASEPHYAEVSEIEIIQNQQPEQFMDLVRAANLRAGVEPPKFDRVAYQREYMRKRRAKAKEAIK